MTCDGTFVYDTTLGKFSHDFFCYLQHRNSDFHLGVCVDPTTIPCGSPCAPDCTTEISEKDIVTAIEEQVECEANYVTSQLVSTIENLIATGQTSKSSIRCPSSVPFVSAKP